MSRPNIILMISHDTGTRLGCYDNQAESPSIDRLASQGCRFDQYFCAAPQCSPSRGSILTGLYPHQHGMMGLSHLGFSITKDVRTLPQCLGEAGYETALIGLHHESIGTYELEDSPGPLGYQTRVKTKGNRAKDVAVETIKYLQDKASGDRTRPFFVNIGFWETHRPFDEYQVSDPLSVSIPKPLPDTENVRHDFAGYQGSLFDLDQAVGAIVEVLDHTNLSNDTLIIYTTDHGAAFPRAKGTLFDAGIQTALIMKWKGVLNEGTVMDSLLSNVDLMPTLLEIGGAELPKGLDGCSFLPLLKGEQAARKDHIFCELTWHDLYHPMRGIRTERYKYIRNFEDGPMTYIPLDIHLSLSGQEVRDSYYMPNEHEELYDLEVDPLEQNNLVQSKDYNQVLEVLRTKLDAWMKDTSDPLLDGPVKGIAAPEWEDEIEQGRTYRKRG